MWFIDENGDVVDGNGYYVTDSDGYVLNEVQFYDSNGNLVTKKAIDLTPDERVVMRAQQENPNKHEVKQVRRSIARNQAEIDYLKKQASRQSDEEWEKTKEKIKELGKNNLKLTGDLNRAISKGNAMTKDKYNSLQKADAKHKLQRNIAIGAAGAAGVAAAAGVGYGIYKHRKHKKELAAARAEGDRNAKSAYASGMDDGYDNGRSVGYNAGRNDALVNSTWRERYDARRDARRAANEEFYYTDADGYLVNENGYYIVDEDGYSIHESEVYDY